MIIAELTSRRAANSRRKLAAQCGRPHGERSKMYGILYAPSDSMRAQSFDKRKRRTSIVGGGRRLAVTRRRAPERVGSLDAERDDTDEGRAPRGETRARENERAPSTRKRDGERRRRSDGGGRASGGAESETAKRDREIERRIRRGGWNARERERRREAM